MQYLGGKARTGKKIAEFLESIRGGRPYYEPFCGSLWVTSRMSGERHASDIVKPLITLYQRIQMGWLPPDTLTEEEYQKYKTIRDPDDPMTAFAGYGCSFGGKYFGGYARGPKTGRNYAANARNSVMRKMAKCQDVSFQCLDYRLLTVTDALIYCDPPYRNTTRYDAVGEFDSEEFWNWCRQMRQNNLLVVSEYQAPEDFRCVLEMPTKLDLKKTDNSRVERLFM